jgi:HEXXH motif-containing protein
MKRLLHARHLADLAAGKGDADAIAGLRRTEYGWRLAALRAVLDQVSSVDSSPLPPVAEPWELLTRVQRAAPKIARLLLVHPPAGTWAAHMLRRLRGHEDEEFAPIWIEIGYLHTLAAAGGVLAGLDFRMVVPAVSGTVVLPTVGQALAVSARRYGTAEVVRSDGTSRVEFGGADVGLPADLSADGPGWRASRSVRVAGRGTVFEVVVEDADPYRAVQVRMPPMRLTAAAFERWRGLLKDAWHLLVDIDPAAAAAIGKALTMLTPLPAAERFCVRSASSGDAFGSLQASIPEDAAQLAAVLVHEFQHTKLGGLMHLVELYDPSCDELFYAPWRDDPRPLPGLLQGIYAFTGVSWFWRAYRSRSAGTQTELAHFEFALWREQTAHAIDALAGHPALTRAGRRLIAALRGRLSPWLAEPVPEPVRTVVADAVADHRATWRVHHLQPSDELAEALAAAWPADWPADVDAATDRAPTVVPLPGRGLLEARAVLARYKLADPAAFSELLSRPPSVGESVAGATAADLHLVAGHHAAARRLYHDELIREPDRRHAWAGLGLALTDPAAEHARAALLHRPELVRAVARRVYRRNGAIDVVALAGWIGRQVGPAARADDT